MDPLAEQLADELAAVAGRRRRVLTAECDTALVEVAPHLRFDPGRRARLRELLVELADGGVIEPSVSQDCSLRPHLPAFVTLVTTVRATTGFGAGEGHPWRPELEWAHRLRLTSAEFDVLLAVQDHRKHRPPSSAVIPHRERSLQLFRDEKRLDRLARGRLFEPGRLSFELLDCWWAPPPLAYRRLDDGIGPIVVTENSAGYHSLPAALTGRASILAYGAGGSFAQSVASLAEIGLDRPVLYIGDLDAEGIAIPQRAAQAALSAGILPPEAFVELWQVLVDAARDVGQPATPVPSEVAAELCEWFGSTNLARDVQKLLEEGVRVPQEAIFDGASTGRGDDVPAMIALVRSSQECDSGGRG